jgi:thiol:disulfide interchange protein DsbC
MNINRMLTKLSAFVFMSTITVSMAFSQANDDALITSLSAKLNLNITSIADSPVPGLKQILTNKGLFYVSDNGEFFLQARVYNLSNGIEDETENALKEVRLDGVKQFKDSAIEFTAKDEKYVINVFTDATCGYCRKLHNEMAQLNDLGITVRYLAWPRAGINSAVYRDTVSIWCSEDPHKAMTDAKAGKSVNNAKCENQVAEQYRFGQQIGVSGTPNIVMPDGSVIPGYQPAQALALALKEAS